MHDHSSRLYYLMEKTRPNNTINEHGSFLMNLQPLKFIDSDVPRSSEGPIPKVRRRMSEEFEKGDISNKSNSKNATPTNTNGLSQILSHSMDLNSTDDIFKHKPQESPQNKRKILSKTTDGITFKVQEEKICKIDPKTGFLMRLCFYCRQRTSDGSVTMIDLEESKLNHIWKCSNIRICISNQRKIQPKNMVSGACLQCNNLDLDIGSNLPCLQCKLKTRTIYISRRNKAIVETEDVINEYKKVTI